MSATQISRSRFESVFSPQELKKLLPADPSLHTSIHSYRHQVRQILNGSDSRILLLIGPCSIHDITGAKEYATHFLELFDEVKDLFFPIMRVYFEKPRTGVGWKGFLHDPYLKGTGQFKEGLIQSRTLLLELANRGVPIGAEILDPLIHEYLGELITWASVGARTNCSQIHRQIASGMPMPVGFKNAIDGDLESSIQALSTAGRPHSFLGINDEGNASIIHTEGNPDTHLILRGAKNRPNYHPTAVQDALSLLKLSGLPERIMIDCSHDNAKKSHEKQTLVFQCAIQQILSCPSSIIGLILESHLKAGNQTLSLSTPTKICPHTSITDPCLDFKTTKELILQAHRHLTSGSVEEFSSCSIQDRIPHEIQGA